MNDISSTGSEPSDRAKQHPRTPLDLRTFNPPLASPFDPNTIRSPGSLG